jgi:hypothetical protein
LQIAGSGLVAHVEQFGAPAQTAAEQHELFVAQSATVHGQQLPDGSNTVPAGQRRPLSEINAGVQPPPVH